MRETQISDVGRTTKHDLPAWIGYVSTLVIEAVLTGLLLLIHPSLPLAQFPTIHILAIMLIAYLFGEGPAVLAFFVGLILFDYFFVPPFYTLIPHAETPMGRAALIAFLMGTSIVAFATIIMRRSRRRIQRLVSKLEEEAKQRNLAMEALERERRRIAAMESLAEATLKAGSFEEVLTTIAIKIREGMNSRSSTVILLDEEKNELEAVAACNIPEAIGFRLLVGEGFAGKILQERRTIYVRDAEHDPLIADSHIKRAGIRSLLGTPLIGRRGAVGVVYVNMKEIHEFSEEDRLLLENLASRTALVIENARLLEEISRNYALLQSALLPVKPPEFPGYLISSAYLPAPRAEIGGDFYDFFLTESGKIAVLIGDVSGKGVPSASLATVARSTVRAFAYDISSPNQALIHANAVLKAAKADPSLFVTLFLVTLNSAGGICYAIAGHPPPAIYRVKTGEVHFLTESGMLLGIVDVHDYEESETHLEVGDKLVLYTDGLSETRRNSEFFGQEGVVRVLNEYGKRSPKEVIEALVRESSEWAGGRRTDDTAIIVIERTE